MDFATMMNLEPHGPDTFVGIGPKYPWGGLYGGQIVAQALRAATLTVEPAFRVHSLHAYFIRRGDHEQPIRFEVDRIRNGRSFVTRSVIARQPVGAILNMSASFQIDEPAPDM
ncbi:MAG TPA: acyl-CoA thioesterase domain-containing protein, partial [Acidimicrobiales bacterium]|nr:acyl-CoA thioesterase domain-containing protein [Acidimicrobiales bacterium]